MKLIPRGQKGDTIVEVLLAIAVVSSVLGISFASINRGLRAGRMAQERTEAVKIAEGEMDKVKAFVTNKGAFPADRWIYCMDPSRPDPFVIGGDANPAAFSSNPPTGAPGVGPGFAAYINDIDSLEPPNITTFAPACTTGPNGRYKIAVVNNQNLVTVIVRWERAGGGNYKDQVILVYRINA